MDAAFLFEEEEEDITDRWVLLDYHTRNCIKGMESIVMNYVISNIALNDWSI